MATDSTYEQQLAALQARLGNENLSTDFQDQQVESSYGFDPKYATDPYTKANLLARASAARFNRSTNSYAARVGGLYSGALSTQRGQDEFSTGMERDQVLREYAAAKQGITDRRLASQADYSSGAINAYQALQDRLNATPAAPAEPPGGAPSNGGAGPGAGPTKPSHVGKSHITFRGKTQKSNMSGGGTSDPNVAKAKAILANPKGRSPAALSWARQILHH